MAEWWSIEVFHGERLPASRWKDAYEDVLTEAAVTHGALYWEWHEYQYGVIFEVCFGGDEQWEAFRNLPTVRGALDAVPDPVSGLIVYRGRGGAAGARKPRKPKPAPSAAALELKEPREKRRIRLRSNAPGDPSELLGTPAPGEVAPVEPVPAEPARHGVITPAAHAG